uniref:Uncharacterized protein n=1 Tax=Rhizophora mucronata TaxID=61149 RepID=A0A2P2L7T7_RHIMU
MGISDTNCDDLIGDLEFHCPLFLLRVAPC